MVRFRFPVTAGLVALTTTVAATCHTASYAADDKPKTHEYRAEHIVLTLPQDVAVKKVDNVDFCLLYFSQGSDHLMTVYMGNAPNFPLDAPKNVKVETTSGVQCVIKSVRWEEPKKGYSRQVLIAVTGKLAHQWPVAYHFMYRGHDTKIRDEADAIIQSAKVGD